MTKTLSIPRPCTRIWLLMMVLTFITWAVAQLGLSGQWLILGVLAIALVKGQLVVDHFMGLRRVRGFWRPLLTGYLLLLGAALAGAFFL
ncbi:MAG: cytochrome C oxidase subunit IV family protein [Gammaproteobacteria bacterium]|nr:cytochrome C oxidase subunit IV family protein [Gammaproteobacteria bacterium]MCW8959666.1 cytochrome C oxidase subunit IV family protein [Gammaproteobacteria bacterium]MCW8972239.1 cytochrome C oxidase subunit IV family protein [Gammaproteobacteria bacterium]MCW8993871.1 cytochrome C oxidase subunit IV family protein [Gammaproteobacteria bacterium]